MESFNPVVPGESDFTLSTLEEKEQKADPFSSNHQTWSKRFHCLQAYFCVFMSFTSTLEFCESLSKYGIVMIIPYCFCNTLVGMPAVLVEVMLGRYVIGNVARAWSMCIPAKGILFCLIGTTLISVAHGNMCSLYLLKYLFSSFTGILKWNTCEESWAKINCYEIGKKGTAILKCMETQPKDFCRNLTWESSGTQFWRYQIQNTNDILNVTESFMCLLISIFSVVLATYKGILSLEKMLTFMTISPILLGVLITFPSLSLPQALFGIKKMFSFKWRSLLEKQIWIDTFEDTFTLLGLGRLSLSYVSSHGKFTDDIIVDIVLITCGSFVLCVFMVFPFLCVMISTKLTEDEEVYNNFVFKDAEDVFITMSEALYQYSFPQELWSIITYLHWFMLSTNAQAVLILAISETLAAMLKKLDKFLYFIGIISILSFVTSLIQIFLPFNFAWILNTPIITVVFLCTITWQLFYGIKKFNNDYYFMMGYPLPIFLKCTWFTLITLVFTELVLKMNYKIPDKPIKDIVYIYVGVPVLIYLLNILFHIFFLSKQKKVLQVFKADPNWGPDNSLLKKSRLIFESGTVTTEFMYRQELYRKPLMKPPNFLDQNIVQLI